MYVPAWLLVLVALLVVWLLFRPRRSSPSFAPVRITIRPEWRALLDDHLDMTPERWEAAEQWIAGHPGATSRLWRDGLTFTVLRTGTDGPLTYLDQHQTFQSALDWSESVPGLCWPSALAARFGDEGASPRLAVQEDADGYELAIEAFDRGMLHASRMARAVEADDDGRVRAIVARLPRALLTAPSEARARALASLGWSTPEADAASAPGTVAQHRYARVTITYV